MWTWVDLVDAWDSGTRIGAQDAWPGGQTVHGRRRAGNARLSPGGIYVYFTYGMHWCANLVCGPEGQASAVLLRAGEVVAGESTARARRGEACPTRDLARGPARLASAIGLSGLQNGLQTTDGDCPVRVVVAVEPRDPALVRTGPRVGVSGAGGDGTAYPWRFWIDGESTVSPYRPGKPRRRP